MDFFDKIKELKRLVIESYDWNGESSFDELLNEKLQDNAELRRFFDENFRNL